MHAQDVRHLRPDVEEGVRLAASLGPDAAAIAVPFA